mmetsp:Transcript_105359/g.298216  ORF Transcript_105359/g.298216 Transcript_105359/m.298216 type:complete len:212 (+) Transcript_105359:482-1117(+)
MEELRGNVWLLWQEASDASFGTASPPSSPPGSPHGSHMALAAAGRWGDSSWHTASLRTRSWANERKSLNVASTSVHRSPSLSLYLRTTLDRSSVGPNPWRTAFSISSSATSVLASAGHMRGRRRVSWPNVALSVYSRMLAPPLQFSVAKVARSASAPPGELAAGTGELPPVPMTYTELASAAPMPKPSPVAAPSEYCASTYRKPSSDLYFL